MSKIPDNIRDKALATLIKDDQHLIGSTARLRSLIDLHHGDRKPETDAQRHFIAAARGEDKPTTDYEKAYLRFLLIAGHLLEVAERHASRPALPSRTARTGFKVGPKVPARGKCDICGATIRSLKSAKSNRTLSVSCSQHRRVRARAEGARSKNDYAAQMSAKCETARLQQDAIREIARRNQEALEREVAQKQKRSEKLGRKVKQAAPRPHLPEIPDKPVESRKRADVDQFGVPYEEGKPRPGWRPLGRYQ